MATTQEAEEAPRSSSSSPLRQMKQRVPGHVPPEYNYAGFDLPRATPDQLAAAAGPTKLFKLLNFRFLLKLYLWNLTLN